MPVAYKQAIPTIVQTTNALQQLPEWSSTSIMITYDDSDGWYDHVVPPIVNQSNDPAQDSLLGSGMCGPPLYAAPVPRDLTARQAQLRQPFLE